jgi:hypothetical protein
LEKNSENASFPLKMAESAPLNSKDGENTCIDDPMYPQQTQFFFARANKYALINTSIISLIINRETLSTLGSGMNYIRQSVTIRAK